MRVITPVVLSVLILGSTAAGPRQSPSSTLDSLLRDAATYLEQYERDVVAVTAQEEYTQMTGAPGVRFRRNLNVPMTALRYLQRQNQSRSSFELVRSERSNDKPMATIRFQEQTAMPPLVGSNEGARAEGLFAIEPGVDRVVRTELALKGPSVEAVIKVAYAEQPALHLWLPSQMDEAYVIRTSGMPNISGRATYTNYRQFKVNTSTDVR